MPAKSTFGWLTSICFRAPVLAVAKRCGLSEQTIHTWRKRFGGFQANDVRG